MAEVVLIEDDDDLRDGLADCLGLMGHCVDGVGSAIELYQLLPLRRFDVAVVDVNLPYHDGFSIVRHLSERTDVKIIVASVREALEDRIRGYQCGADIYMTKPIDPEELSAAIQSLVGKRRVATAEPGKSWTYRPQAMEMTAPNGRQFGLTRREARFLGFLLGHPAGVVTRENVLAALGDEDVERSRRNLDTLVSRLRSKVKAQTGLALPIDTVQGSGFSFRDPVRVEAAV